MMALLESNLGTENTDWFCAAEALINCIFNLKDKRSHEYAKLFLESLTRSLYSGSDSQNGNVKLNQGVSEIKYAQIFYVAGHTAIKMLKYFECLENELKKGVQKEARANEQRRSLDGQGNESPSKEDDLA
jgi:hypothetical protein